MVVRVGRACKFEAWVVSFFVPSDVRATAIRTHIGHAHGRGGNRTNFNRKSDAGCILILEKRARRNRCRNVVRILLRRDTRVTAVDGI